MSFIPGFYNDNELYNARGHKLRFPSEEKAQFVTVTGIKNLGEKNMPIPQTNRLNDDAAYLPESPTRWGNLRKVLQWFFAGLPLGGVIWASFLPLQAWMQQALVLVVLLWFCVFFLLDTFFMAG
jgi:hypothetical protein